MSEIRELLGALEPVSLAELDERAALLRRVDNKYAVPAREFEQLGRRLLDDHQILDIDGRRVFRYSTTYFETPELRCFIDHVEDRVPRFKARSRLYEDSGECVFEVKLKRSEDETDKRQISYAPDVRHTLTDGARECLRSALEDVGIKPVEDLRAGLTSEFARVTFASRTGSERLTCDLGVRLIGAGEQSVKMRGDLVLVETKSEDGTSPADRELGRMGIRPISLSKYRVGMSLVGRAQHFGSQPGADLFERP